MKKFLYSIEEDYSDDVGFRGIFTSIIDFIKQLKKQKEIKSYKITKYPKNENLPSNRGKGEILVEFVGYEVTYFYHRAIINEMVETP